MTPQEMAFYSNDVLVEQFDYTVVAEDQATPLKNEGVVSRVAGGVAAFVCGGLLVFGPLGLASSSPLSALEAPEQVIVRLKPPATEAPEAKMSAYHRRASREFRSLFNVVPVNPAEEQLEEEPDYGF